MINILADAHSFGNAYNVLTKIEIEGDNDELTAEIVAILDGFENKMPLHFIAALEHFLDKRGFNND